MTATTYLKKLDAGEVQLPFFVPGFGTYRSKFDSEVRSLHNRRLQMTADEECTVVAAYLDGIGTFGPKVRSVLKKKNGTTFGITQKDLEQNFDQSVKGSEVNLRTLLEHSKQQEEDRGKLDERSKIAARVSFHWEPIYKFLQSSQEPRAKEILDTLHAKETTYNL